MKQQLRFYFIGFWLLFSLKNLHANSIPESPIESSQESQRGAALTSEEKSKVDFDSLIPAEELSQILGQTENLLRNPEDKKPQDSEGQVFRPRLPRFPYPFPHHYPHYPYYPSYPNYPYPYRVYTYNVICYASDMNGNTYSAVGYNPYDAQQFAMNQCFNYSNMGCYARGCNYYH
mgnify:CR=1 FL=1